MKIIKRIYNYILKIGQSSKYPTPKNKKIKLLNIYILINIHFSLLMPVGDAITGILNFKIFTFYVGMFLAMLLLLKLVSINKIKLVTVLWIVILLFSIFMFSVVLVPESYNEYYFVFVPGIALTLFNKNKIAICITMISLFLFCVPYYIIRVYPLAVVNKLDVFAVIGLFSCVYLLVNYFKKTNIENEQKLELAYAKLEVSKENELASLRLKLLKSKMNPHFMFNTLNSVQNLVIKGEKKKTYTYLSKFSRLVRENINTSEKICIPLEKEILLIEEYLELEKLRFNGELKFDIISNIKNENIGIPSMVIQPFLENTLHRIFHQVDRYKRIKIKISKNKNTIDFTLLDNGITAENLSKITGVGTFYDTIRHIEKHIELINSFYNIDVEFEHYSKRGVTVCKIKIPYSKKC
ncbi:histidine kinase [Wenyingzhuangia sp. IMCC45533]